MHSSEPGKTVREDRVKKVQLCRLGKKEILTERLFLFTGLYFGCLPFVGVLNQIPKLKPSPAAWPEKWPPAGGLKTLRHSLGHCGENVCTRIFSFTDLFSSGSSCSIFMEPVSVLCSPDQKRWSLLYPLAMLLSYMRVNLPSYLALCHEGPL